MGNIEESLAAMGKKGKFARTDREYLARRQRFAEALGLPDLFGYVDHFGLYAGEQTLGARLFAYEAVKRSLAVPGHIMEFGVWHGGNLMFMAKMLRLMQPNSPKLVFGVDNFAGLPEPDGVDGEAAAGLIGKYRGDEEVLRAAIELYEMDDWVHLVVGDANETIPAFERAWPEALVSLAWIDFDLYQPCKAALDFLSRHLAIGGVIVFDEAVSHAWPGETQAMVEFLAESGGTFRMEANTLSRQPTMLVVREA